ncbi:MAG: polyprenyl synthetase family protein [Balneolaceae bacterium]
MGDPAVKILGTKTDKASQLSDIVSPIQSSISEFRKFFRDSVSTDVYLLDKIIQYLLRQKGKEIRPTLVFMSARMFGDIDQRSYVAATMIELLHTATLIHDDVVDEADKRRGFLSVNKLWRNKAGVLLGDFLLSKGLLIALDYKEYELLHVLSDAVNKMSEGELRQLKTSRLFNMTEERYYQIISEKTASLIAACCKCGAVSTSGDEMVHNRMYDVGMKIGIAFQIKDDLFDYGLEDIGKPTRNDIKERKMTLPLIKALAKSKTTEQIYIRSLMMKRKKSPADIEKIVSFVHDNDGMAESRKAMTHYAEEALQELRQLPVNEGYREFEALVHYIITRKK